MSGVQVIVGGAAKNDKPSGIIGGAAHEIYDRHVIVGGAAKLVYRRGAVATGQYYYGFTGIDSDEAREAVGIWQVTAPTVSMSNSGLIVSGFSAYATNFSYKFGVVFIFDVVLPTNLLFATGKQALKINQGFSVISSAAKWSWYSSAEIFISSVTDITWWGYNKKSNDLYATKDSTNYKFDFVTGQSSTMLADITQNVAHVEVLVVGANNSVASTQPISFTIPNEALSIFAGDTVEEYPIIFE